MPKRSRNAKVNDAGPSRPSTSTELVQIQQLERSLLSSAYDPNPLLPLLSLARDDSAEIVHKAVWSLHRVFIHFIDRGRIGSVSADSISRSVEMQEGEVQVKSWVRDRLMEYVEILGGLVRDAEAALRVGQVRGSV